MKLEFIKIEIQNFKSVGELVELNYEDLKGLNFIFGKNMDVPNAKNGSGKCLHPDTKITIDIDDEEVKQKFLEFLKKEK